VARKDAIVLGAGIVGTSVALHLVKRGLAVALIDRRAPGTETSYGNAGVLESETLFPHAFPSSLGALLRIALKRAPEADYHLGALPGLASWLMAYRRNTRLHGRVDFATKMRPLFARAVAEHEALMAESDATRYLRRDGWIKIYRTDAAFEATQHERDLADELGVAHRDLSTEDARVLEPSLEPVFARAVHWLDAATVSNPLAVTRAYAERFAALGGAILEADARSLHRVGASWRVSTERGALDASDVVVALGPWAPDLLAPLGLDLPLKFKRGYHRHYRPVEHAPLRRTVVDTTIGFCLAPMEQGIRLTTGAEFADRDAPATPVQIRRVLPHAKALLPFGEAIEATAWMGSRPCFADSMPVIGRAPGRAGLWLAYGHAHWGLTLGPVTGRLVADLVTGATPCCDPAPYSAARFMAERPAVV
jgi:D-amino-acid dehydrogenase